MKLLLLNSILINKNSQIIDENQFTI